MKCKEKLGNYSIFKQTLSMEFHNLINSVRSLSCQSKPTIIDAMNLGEGVMAALYLDCTPDLIRTSDCHNCLQTGFQRLPMNGEIIGQVYQPSCQLGYVIIDYQTALPSVSIKKLYVALGVLSPLQAISLLIIIFLIYNRKRRKATKEPKGYNDDGESMESLHFELDVIKDATRNFSNENKLGHGGFGDVYKGELRNGQELAIKRLSNTSGQGIREFKTEACLAAKLRHKNLVKLHGFCSQGNEMLLVYEFVPNKSLDRFLYDESRAEYLTWEIRYKIIVGIARGLLYLHEDSLPKIIHRDLKPSNILLNGEMNPKIADFGLAKLFEGGQTQGNTSRIAGTFGYIAPEYAIAGHFSEKSDIFSYGVILLEIISGMMNNSSKPYTEDADNLVNYAWRLWNNSDHMRLLDSKLGSEFSKSEVERCIHVGLLCVQEDPDKRPNIHTVLVMLNIQPVTLPKPESPPNFPHKREIPPVFEVSTSQNLSLNMVTSSTLCPR